VKASKGNNKKNRTTGKYRNGRKQLLPAIMAVGGACSMMAVSASALELGELKVNSTLGQPLRASIAYALNPHEAIYDYCVYLRPGLAANGLPSVSKATISIADGMILLAGNRVIREPLLTMQVSVDCPYTAHLTRQFTLMIDPAQPIAEAPVADASVVVESSTASRSVAVTSTAAAEVSKPQARIKRSRNTDRSPISENSRYLVKSGDSLGNIAERIPDRSIALWPAVDRIFAANPDAFVNGDRNWLKAGSWLEIPDLSVAASEPMVAEAVMPAPSEPGYAQAYTGYEAPAALETEEIFFVPDEGPAATVSDAPETEVLSVSEPDTGISEFANLRPGDIVFGDDSPFVSPIGAPADGDITGSMMFPDTEFTDPRVVQPIAAGETSGDGASIGSTSGSWSWLMWLGGTGLALILGLLLFGQKFRQRFGSMSIATPLEPQPNRRKTDPVQQAKAIDITDVDFEVPVASPHSSSITLDADFDDGTGLQEGSDIDVAQDFGFSASTDFEGELDMVLPESVEEEDSSETDIIPPPEREDKNSILDNEITPSDDDSQYDLSMIVDATKQNLGEMDSTTKDLQAVLVEIDNTTESEDPTVRQEADYKILEQDYEEEFTATQALNEEIAKAAEELATRMDTDDSGEITAELPKNTPARNDDISDLDSTSIQEGPTTEMSTSDFDVTVVMPANDDDVTVDMLVESGRIDTKKKKKAS
jgi:hypothetical protein